MISLVLLIVSFSSNYAVVGKTKNHWAHSAYENFKVHKLVLRDSQNMLSEYITFEALEEIFSKILGEEILINESLLEEKVIEEKFLDRGV